ncbi:Rieske (2Fe-2S) protein [Frankia sp. Mgl5]|uniref:Rieske (2Fe-2S) protein n=1 Tax=Frankia sp. Mgl5 TaxID=2933793 RepID=UPI00200E71AA|nr:Rieske (2Fe-2S) protein [Frankia sp. Mgl5]MCK9931074.1 Rieske (2Fe-2S) protein [Frankia sp. Mgl5]
MSEAAHPAAPAGMLSRRAVPGLVAVVAGVAGYVVASGSDAAEPKPATAAANGGGGAGAGGGQRLAGLAEVPAGGGLVLDDIGVVLTRSAADEVLAFSAVCTHQGCTVGSVAGGTINCPCHGSKFDAATGAPVAGPAKTPLAPVAVVVQDDTVFTA